MYEITNLYFLKKLHTEGHGYWILERKYLDGTKGIIFAKLTELGFKSKSFEKHSLADIIKISKKEIACNIFLNTNTTPFQIGLRLEDINDGFLVSDNKKISTFEFIRQIMNTKVNNLYEAEKIHQSCLKEE